MRAIKRLINEIIQGTIDKYYRRYKNGAISIEYYNQITYILKDVQKQFFYLKELKKFQYIGNREELVKDEDYMEYVEWKKIKQKEQAKEITEDEFINDVKNREHH